MKTKIILFAAFVLTSGHLALHAQPQATAPTFKVAVFDSTLLTDEKAGVKKLVAAYKSIDAELKPRKDELAALKAKYDPLVKDVENTQSVADPNVIRAKLDEAENIKRTLERKAEDGQAVLDRRMKEVTNPIYQDIGNALQAFAKQRGFDMIFDLAKLSEAIMVVNADTDITPAFINDYNAKHAVAPAGVPMKTP